VKLSQRTAKAMGKRQWAMASRNALVAGNRQRPMGDSWPAPIDHSPLTIHHCPFTVAHCRLPHGHCWSTPVRGLSLIEAILSLVVLGILMAAMASVVTVTSRAAEVNQGPSASPATAAKALDLLSADLRLATAFTAAPTSSSLSVTVPDCTGDGVADTVAWAWSGNGSAELSAFLLTRSVNGQPATTVASDVQLFDLTTLTRTVTAPPSPTLVESSEQPLIFHDDAPGGSFSDFGLSKDNWCATYFKPSMPPYAVSWKITRVKFIAKRDGTANETALVQIRTATAALKPSSTVLASATIAETSLASSSAWVDVSFTPLANLDPLEGYCLVISQPNNSGNAGKVQFESNGNPMPFNAHFMKTTDAAANWSNPNSGDDLRFYVYGTITTQQ
jgi:type II secretory pathway pseudopilin PulG